MKAIMYHYVMEFNKSTPFFRFLDIANFRKQLDFFGNNFGFISKVEWRNFIENGKIENCRNKILLTFDDALKCHFEYVYPELEKRGLFGIFYVPTFPYKKNQILDVHKIHLLCGTFDGLEIYENLLSLIDQKMISEKRKVEFKNKTYKSQKNPKYILEVKRILNYFIEYKYRKNIIDKLAEKLSYKFDSSSFYLSKADIKEMNYHGHIFGSHTVNHYVMSKLKREDQIKEIKESFDFLESIGCNNERTYCHPYGGFHSFNRDTIDLLNYLDVKYSFNVESRDIKEKDKLNSIHFLPRYDCNEFLYGKAS